MPYKLHHSALCRAKKGELGRQRRAAPAGTPVSADCSEDSSEEDSGEQLVLALQSLQQQLNPEPEPKDNSKRPTPPEPGLARIPYPRVDFSQVAQGRRLLGGLAGGHGSKTQLEQEIRLATSKVDNPVHIHNIHGACQCLKLISARRICMLGVKSNVVLFYMS